MSFERIQRVKDRIIELRGDEKSGAEHYVWLDKAKGVVRKIPSQFGQWWQKMHPDFAERDLKVLRDNNVPLVPTEVHHEPEILLADETRSRVDYVLEQPLYEDSHSMTFGDMLHNDKYRDELLEFTRKGMDIRRKEGLGLDLLGGKTFKLVAPALNPKVKEMPADVANLLVADGTITANRDWSDYGISKGDVIARVGDVKQCDTRLFDFDREGGLKNKLLKCLLLKNQDVQDTALWTLLESFGKKVEFDREKTWLRRRIRQLVEHAIPKMQAYAEIAA